MSEEDVARYRQAAHAMQSGVKLDQELGSPDGSPKHLRVGVNSAMVDHAALVQLLIAKGILTEDEYHKAIADGMEAEVERYRERLQLPSGVKLG